MALDNVSIEKSKSFVTALQELNNLRPQLYYAAEYCEKLYFRSEQKQILLVRLPLEFSGLIQGFSTCISEDALSILIRVWSKCPSRQYALQKSDTHVYFDHSVKLNDTLLRYFTIFCPMFCLYRPSRWRLRAH